MDQELSPSQAAETANHLMAAKMFSLACCVMLFYDIAITFGDEVEKIWKRPFSGATVLWALNRYLSPLGYIVIIVSFQDPDWSLSVCNRYVLYPEILKVFTTTTIGIIFILRLYSIHGQSRSVLVAVGLLLMAELGVKIWAFTGGTRVDLPTGLVGCILTGKPHQTRIVFTWVAELVFGIMYALVCLLLANIHPHHTIIFVLTLHRTLTIYSNIRHGSAIPLIKIMMRDGIIYFAVIFAANLVTVLLYIILPADLKAVNASFSTLITSLMVSRLILNLRSNSLNPKVHVYPNEFQSDNFSQAHITSSIMGNLGNPVLDWGDDDDDYEEKEIVTHPTQIVVEVTQDVITDQSIALSFQNTDQTHGHNLHNNNSRESWTPPRSWMLDEEVVQLQELRKI